jgi:hypothetical protein
MINESHSADQKPSTLKLLFGMISFAINIIAALITRRKIPNVKIVAGIVRTTNSGLMKVFNNASTRAVTRAIQG